MHLYQVTPFSQPVGSTLQSHLVFTRQGISQLVSILQDSFADIKMIKLEVNPEVFGTFAFYAALLGGKMLIMSLLTARQRFSKKVFANPEDTAADPKGSKVKYDDVDVERVRRAHLNDVENILPYFVTGLLYCFTNPEVATAKLVFRVFCGARFLHTFVYAIKPLPQPSRALAWGVGYAVNFYVIYKTLTHFA